MHETQTQTHTHTQRVIHKYSEKKNTARLDRLILGWHKDKKIKRGS